jgi:predicted nucleotidyltransferase
MEKVMTREKVIRTLKKYKAASRYKGSIRAIGLFGSVAKGVQKTGSDVDVFVELDPPRMFDLIGIKQDLERVLRCKVDIAIIRKRMNPILRDQIESHGIFV